MDPVTCGRCRIAIPDGVRREMCWLCEADLCGPCWEAVGHCGHPEADRANQEARSAFSWDERQAAVRRALESRGTN